MKQKVRTLLSGQIPVAVIFAILGVCLIFVPAATFNVISKVVFGLALILSGIYHVISFTFPKKGMQPSALDLYPGVISLVLGIFLFTNPQLVRVLLPWVLGAFLIADCIWMVKNALQMRTHGIAMWEVLIGAAAVFVVLGIVLIANPFAQVRTMLTFAGWLLLVKAILDIVLYLQSKKKIDAVLAAQAAKTRKAPESYAIKTVEPQRPAAPSWLQQQRQKAKEKKEAREAAREAARQREEADKAERIRRAQEEAQEDYYKGGAEEKSAFADEAMDADFTQTEASPEEEPVQGPVYDVDYTEVETPQEEGEEE